MIRALSIFGFGALFLIISPAFRGNVMDGISTGFGSLDKYSPWSYVACAVIGLICVTFSLNQGSRPG
ncbi:MAG TPA: hypothetical protein VNY05_06430 [Candidatus Acidoferrales bacterium]|jgi:hypothetical protein|nr:hypothetical protein [Candidatus Acidoferrales bacterium]